MESSKRNWRSEETEEVTTLVGLYFVSSKAPRLFGCIIGQPNPGHYLVTYHVWGESSLERIEIHNLVRHEEMDGWWFFRDPADYEDTLKVSGIA